MSKASSSPSLAVIILAAGQGKRMKSALPKVMHKIAGRPMILWLIETAEKLKPEKIIVVTSPDQDDLASVVAPHHIAIQKEQKGTGDAVKPALSLLKGFKGKILILLGDEPFVDLKILQKMVSTNDLCALAIEQENPAGLGRMILNDDGTLNHIVEEKDCTKQQLQINLCNAGNYCMPAKHIESWLSKLKNKNAQGEYYLPDIPSIAAKDGFVTHVVTTVIDGGWGINNRKELAFHEAQAQNLLRDKAMENGVTFIDPTSVTLAWDTKFGNDVIIEPNVFFGKNVKIGNNVIIHGFSHIEGATIKDGASIGPFARIRPTSVIEEKASIGNFIEVNRSTIKKGAKAKHVSYIGDAVIGENTNIGAGTIIANYDGFFKHKTTIGKEVFIGSNSTIIAPVKIGDGAIIAAGSDINKDVSINAMAIGRSRQENHAGWASEYRKLKQERKKQEED